MGITGGYSHWKRLVGDEIPLGKWPLAQKTAAFPTKNVRLFSALLTSSSLKKEGACEPRKSLAPFTLIHHTRTPVLKPHSPPSSSSNVFTPSSRPNIASSPNNNASCFCVMGSEWGFSRVLNYLVFSLESQTPFLPSLIRFQH